MLGRRRRRRANIDPPLVQCLVFEGIGVPNQGNTKRHPNVGIMLGQRRRL